MGAYEDLIAAQVHHEPLAGAATGPNAWVPQATYFPGSGWIAQPSQSTLTSTANLTVAFYVNLDKAATREVLWEAGGGNGLVVYKQAGTLYAIAARSNNVDFTSVPITEGVWHHVVAVFSASAIRLYVDGVLAAENTSLANAFAGTGGNAGSIAAGNNFFNHTGGNERAAGERPLEGFMSDVRVWGDPLTAADAAVLATGPVADVLPSMPSLRTPLATDLRIAL